MDEARQNFELALMAEVEKRKLPTLGVCFGSQLMNVIGAGVCISFCRMFEAKDAIEHRRQDRISRRGSMR
jgi:gamma-glutamyl-gamma-aminobutyrate hydrolase PuuD